MRERQRALILVLGASGVVGRYALPRVAAAGASVLAVSRRPPVFPGGVETWFQHDLDDAPMASDATVLLSLGPLRHAVRQLDVCPRLGRVVALSSASVLFKRQSPDPAERAAIEALIAHEDELLSRCRQRSIPVTLLRPCMIYGAGDRNVQQLAALTRRLPIVPVCGRGLRQPVHAEDLARVSINALKQGGDGAGVYALGGGETIDYLQMVRRISAQCGNGHRVVRVPRALLAVALGIGHAAGFLTNVSAAMLRRQAVDLVVDDRAARDRLGWAPRPFRPGPCGD